MKTSTTAERLKLVMEQHELKQADVLRKCERYCEKFGIKLQRNDISQYLSGKVLPSQKKLTVLALGLNVTEPWLMGYDVNPNEVDTTLTPHERNLILAYRYNTNMQEAVDRILGVEEPKAPMEGQLKLREWINERKED